jgi:hypothetical protein
MQISFTPKFAERLRLDKGVQEHLNEILSAPEVDAIQWAQGMGDDYPIIQWLPFLKDLQSKKVPVGVDLAKEDLDPLIQEVRPEGLFLWVATQNEEEEKEI